MKKDYLEAGEFVTTHGIAGELRLYPWSDGPDFLAGFSTFYLDGAGRRPLQVAQIRPHKNICIVRLEGVDSIEAARPMIGRTVYIAREDANLPAGRFFVQDILGAEVVDDATGESYGTIHAVTHPGRHDVYEIHGPAGQVWFFPAAEPFIAAIDLEAGRVRVKPIEGMFEAESPKAEKPKRKQKPDVEGAGEAENAD